MNMEKSKNNEKMMKKKYNNRYMEDITTIELIQNSKRPMNKWKKKENQFKTNIYEFNPKKQNCNLGVPTGKVNNILVVDLDFYPKKGETFDFEKTQFYKIFGKNYIEDFDTFTVKSASGGLHLYFKYDENVDKTTSNGEEQVDTRGNGGYIVSPNSIINGNKYEIIKDTHFKHLPDNLKDYLSNVIFNRKDKPKKKPKKKKKEIKKTENKDEEVIEEEGYYHLDKFTYNFSDELLIEIIEGLPDKYFNTYQGWLIFTTAMKQINRKDLWEKYPKLNNPVDGNIKSQGHIDWMNDAWDGIKRHNQYNCLSNLLLNTKVRNARTMLEYYMYIDYDVHTTKPDVIINQAKLTDENYSDFLDKKNYDCLIMKSDTGTGKTTSFTKYFLKEDNNTKFLSIVSRVSLAQEQYMTFSKSGIDCGLYNIIDGRLKSNDNYVITIDSILRVANWNSWEYKNYIVYLDEFNSMIEYLICADTLNNKRVVVFNALLKILNNCKKIICTDADINDISLSFLKLVDKNKIFIQNDFLHNKNVKCQELFKYSDFCDKLRLEKKFLCCCDSKTQAEMIHQELINRNVRDVELITSDTDKYINLDDYDKIIYSPKIVYGLDSSIERPVYCYYKERTIPPTAMIQQIARCRNIKYLRYTFEMKKVKIEDEDFSLDYVKQELKELESFGNEFCSFSLMCNNFISEAYLDFYTKYTYLNRCYQINKFGHFIKLLQKRGFVNDSITYYNTELKGTREMRSKIKELKLENFSVEHPTVIKINDYLKIDTKENIEKYKEYFLNQTKLDNHFNIAKYFFNNFEDVREELFLQEEFNVKKVSSTKAKIKFLQEIKDLTGCSDNDDIIIKNPLEIKDADFYATNYNKVWNASIKKSDIDFTNKKLLTQYMYKMYKKLFGNQLVENTKPMINGKRETVYKFNKKILEEERTLYGFRQKVKNKG